MISRYLRLYAYRFATAFNSNKDYYKILNVKQTATTQQIKKSFRTLAKQYHPDANKGNEQKFKQLNEAYQVLSSDVMKKDYDDARRSQSSTYQHTSNTSNTSNTYNRYGNPRQQSYNNTYRGYQQDYSWRNRDFREQTINNMYQRQQQEFYRQTNSRYGTQHDQTLRNRNSHSRGQYNFNHKSQEDMEGQIDQMLRKNAQRIKITRQSVRRAYEQEQKRRQKQYQEYKDKRNNNMAEDMKDRAFKMAEGIKDNIDGIAKVGKYVKENLDSAIKVGKFAKKLWDQYKKK